MGLEKLFPNMQKIMEKLGYGKEPPKAVVKTPFEKMLEDPKLCDFENATGGKKKVLTDGQRLYPVDYLIIHHSAGNPMKNRSALEVMDAYDNIGYGRGYSGYFERKNGRLPKKGEMHSHHTHPLRDKETFAQAQFSLQPYDLDQNKYGWRLVPLMLDWWRNVAWHAGNWEINRRSIGIEINGVYTDKFIEEGALWCIADAFRPHWEKNLKDEGKPFIIKGHREVSVRGTLCPGKLLEQLPTLRNMMFGIPK